MTSELNVDLLTLDQKHNAYFSILRNAYDITNLRKIFC